MDDSESSDIFSELSGNNNYSRSIDIENYETLIKKIKAAQNVGTQNLQMRHFNSILDDCKACINQQLNQINSLLEDSDTQIDKLCGYIEDAICILQILSNYVKVVFESVAITCSTVKYFSTYTGNIILSVFTHCRDSECIYGNRLCMVEQQLKNLFRNCHELQLTYLMALEKYLIFDLTETEDQEILIKTLEINLTICDVVQSLDIKTMAEQWKAYVMICEKYSSFLLNENVFNTTSKLLASTIENNVKAALEANEDDKIILRSLKVANFSLKILLRICNIFKGSLKNHYDHIIKLLITIGLCRSSYYEITGNRSAEFTLLMNTHISIPLEILIDSLLEDENFSKLIFQTSANELRDSELLGYMLLIIMMMKAFQQKDVSGDSKLKIVVCVLTTLPYYHKWFNVGLKLNLTEDNSQPYGLYENLLLHTVAVSVTLSGDEYKILEAHLYELLLGTEYYSALFASNLWVLLCRVSNSQLQVDVLSGLLHTHQKLETHALFYESPQRVHLYYTIQTLFRTLDKERKMLIYKRFSVTDKKNVGIWSALNIKNLKLSSNDMKTVDRFVWDSLFERFNDVLGSTENGLEDLIKYLKLASTCPFEERDLRKEELLMRAWKKACPTCNNVVLHRKGLDESSVWLFRYLECLAFLTAIYMEKLQRKTLVNILNIISKLLQKGNSEIIYLLLKLFCKLSSFLTENRIDVPISHIEFITSLFEVTIKTVLQESNVIIEQYVKNMVADDDLAETLVSILQYAYNDSYKNKFSNINDWGKQLELAAYNNYTHKCIENTQTSVIEDMKIDSEEIKEQKSIDSNIIIERIKTDSEEIKEHISIDSEELKESNFDLGDVDSLFDVSDGEEPASKKMKLDFDVDNLIGRIESDVEQVCQVKENILGEYKSRIKRVCDKLQNIVS